MNKNKIIALMAVSLLATSCNNSNKTKDDYDKNWTPGAHALDNADQPLIKNPQGIYNDLGKMRASQGKAGLPQQGKANILVVPVEFSDDKANDYNYTSGAKNRLNGIYFENDGSEEELPSVVEYYNQSSKMKLNLSGVVTPVVKLENAITDYIYDSIVFGTEYVVKEIVDYVYDFLFEETETYYLKDFDADDDGKIDAIALNYSWFPAEVYYMMGYPDMYEFVSTLLTTDVYFNSELGNDSPVNSVSWLSGRSSEVSGIKFDSHTAINHTARQMGVEDYRDTTGTYDGFIRSPLAHRDMMDGYISDHNPFTKYQLGWIEPTKVVASKLNDQETYTLKPYSESGDVLMLSPEETGIYGEYLMLEYYTPTALNAPDSETAYLFNLYGNVGYKEPGIRVYKVDARLVEGISNTSVAMADGAPDFTKEITLDNGKKAKAYYDYAFSNSGYNEYSDSGIFEDYPLIEELSKNGFNRHMTDTTFALSDDDLFLEGDSFGKDGDIDGFYTNFALDGNGDGELKLGLTFTVDSLSSDEAKVTVRRAK